jgi:hypothetical protein
MTMNRITSLLALSAIVVAGAFAGTSGQASASNVSVSFNVHNGDGSANMILTAQSAGISGLTNPAAAISPGNYDPASAAAQFSAPTPASIGDYAEGYVRYAVAGSPSSSVCSFNMRVTRLGLHSFKLHFWISESGTNCSVPGDAINSDGVFTTVTYGLNWKT